MATKPWRNGESPTQKVGISPWKVMVLQEVMVLQLVVEDLHISKWVPEIGGTNVVGSITKTVVREGMTANLIIDVRIAEVGTTAFSTVTNV